MNDRVEKSIASELKLQATILCGFIAIFWVVEICDRVIFGGSLDRYGIQPHTLIGLRGILFAPFLHGNFAHLIANTIPFLILGWLVMLQETSDFWLVTAVTMLIGGLGTWFFGGSAIHIGASSLIYGYLGFLLLRGYFERNFVSIFLSVVVFFFYRSIIWGVLPSDPRISWQGHLFGFIGGILAARLIGRRKRERRNVDDYLKRSGY
ncbi:rhomboid family intramembrane serine protease [Oscillatoria sp. FACHB-1406]|uniref:rhomboid family intramembrane serine protease n=1 Tax=Oscillatoria sp. FACHB-1406 TaxID=2692846 RepID=UPI0016856AAF|nr:rhomboid family intramembrane serine protease [Oscillatoria sp. FACHB-1406]MBD2579032.1 rhomboid family intramembrane serine protease [Oscillatoria sp. FACHB-1406]